MDSVCASEVDRIAEELQMARDALHKFEQSPTPSPPYIVIDAEGGAQQPVNERQPASAAFGWPPMLTDVSTALSGRAASILSSMQWPKSEQVLECL